MLQKYSEIQRRTLRKTSHSDASTQCGKFSSRFIIISIAEPPPSPDSRRGKRTPTWPLTEGTGRLPGRHSLPWLRSERPRRQSAKRALHSSEATALPASTGVHPLAPNALCATLETRSLETLQLLRLLAAATGEITRGPSGASTCNSPVLSGAQNRRETRKKKTLTLRSVEFLRVLWQVSKETSDPRDRARHLGRPGAVTSDRSRLDFSSVSPGLEAGSPRQAAGALAPRQSPLAGGRVVAVSPCPQMAFVCRVSAASSFSCEGISPAG
uniref:Uncharacterized protein n=1 Tax=Rangifer tarandus platyrhynchus TaxID=3082113 RepID=A0ACB0F3X7_RANTA|nr:unnamed protein product [Rangifer tarandus platyrhynchus]